MPDPEVATVVTARSLDRRHEYSPLNRLKVAGAGFFAVSLLAAGFMSAPSKAVLTDDDKPSGVGGQVPGASNPSDFIAAARRTQKEQHDRMTRLANQLIKTADVPHLFEGRIAMQPFKLESARASLRSAELAREAAEIALVEFEKGMPQEEVHAKEQLKLAQRHLERLRQHIPQSKERRAQIEQAAKGANIDVAPLVSAELEEKKAVSETELAESKLKALINDTHPEQLEHLRSAVDKATAAERTAQAQRQFEQSVSTRLKAMVKARDVAASAKAAPSRHDRQALAALERAISVEERLRPKVEQLLKDGNASEQLRQEIQDLTAQVQSLIDQAEIERTAAQFEELKTRLLPAAAR